MTVHNYAIVNKKGEILNVIVVDDEAVGFDDERGKWEPWGIKEAEEQGLAYLGPQDAPLTEAWIGSKATARAEKTDPHDPEKVVPADWVFEVVEAPAKLETVADIKPV